MQDNNYLYSFTYNDTESELCKLESRYIFDQEEKNRLLISPLKIAPSSSAFIKNRLDIIAFSDDYTTLIRAINQECITIEGFKVEYHVFYGDTTNYADRLDMLRDIGYNINGYPDYHHPTRTYALCFYEDIWYFGTVIKDKFDWYKHNQKPYSYSNSISINIAKSLVNIAAKANRDMEILDACCGVGTIMLEACFAGYTIEGNDINPKICQSARDNLSFFDYRANVFCSDIKTIQKTYDVAIIDLPYNLMSVATELDLFHIIKSTTEITDRMVIVSASDISSLIANVGFRVSDSCSVSKKGKTTFARKIWVCEKDEK
ncbi:TRM11 family SAM-dependent methyltransferase [Portibacter lacus]|uniref:Methyltransferase n=1 Tax=Portibacter lacus TaxID=1099794 RepID=A0AA37SYF5_9BACT|nr:hypothetical protein [Portibacter lacus]GLR19938.1 methyltransferase [Portibacter lacus]